jgi:hypothetical protein
MMITDIQWFAFVVLPLSIGVAALLGAYLIRRNQLRHEKHSGR